MKSGIKRKQIREDEDEILNEEEASPKRQKTDYNRLSIIKESITKYIENKEAALFQAAKTGDTEYTQALIELEVNLEATNKDGLTPIMVAAQFGHAEVIEQLAKAGANVEKKDDHGTSAMVLAILNGRLEAIKTLLKFVEIEFDLHRGMTPLFVACCLPILWEDESLQGFLVVDKDSVDIDRIIDFLLEKGANVRAQYKVGAKVGATPLHIAALSGLTRTIEKLIAAGADVNAQVNVSGDTPLSLAFEKKGLGVGMIKKLIQLGATLYPKDEKGVTIFSKTIKTVLPTLDRDIIQVLALEKADGHNRFNEFEPIDTGMVPSLRKKMGEYRKGQLLDNSLYYLLHLLLNDNKTAVQAKALLEGSVAQDIDLFTPDAKVAKNRAFIKGMQILSNTALPDELRTMILGWVYSGPLSYTVKEDNKLRCIANNIGESKYGLKSKC